ncbi:hypothetical protein HPB47_011736 [Ixodes persulcatus]|uniref:Uncharacterized protein n=1 Tax=Ixodes persulcatus TaxID=34615 RepID=A0AC60NVJ4_IXOPE|nr:hypothetical protein HPB47_011736 [Ixodes persulcatus]
MSPGAPLRLTAGFPAVNRKTLKEFRNNGTKEKLWQEVTEAVKVIDKPGMKPLHYYGRFGSRRFRTVMSATAASYRAVGFQTALNWRSLTFEKHTRAIRVCSLCGVVPRMASVGLKTVVVSVRVVSVAIVRRVGVRRGWLRFPETPSERYDVETGLRPLGRISGVIGCVNETMIAIVGPSKNDPTAAAGISTPST